MIVNHKGNNRGTSTVHRFENGYGASVITDGYGSQEGLLELAVIKWDGEDFKLTYETPITSDVLGYLTEGEVADALTRIEALAPADIVAEKVARKRQEVADLRAQIERVEAQIADIERTLPTVHEFGSEA